MNYDSQYKANKSGNIKCINIMINQSKEHKKEITKQI